MDYRDANSIERDRVSHYNRSFGSTKFTPSPYAKPVRKRTYEQKLNWCKSQPGYNRLNEHQIKQMIELI